MQSGDLLCVDRFGRTLASVAVKMFLHLIYFKINFISAVLLLQFTKMILYKLYDCSTQNR
jgi:hypothetical protein